MSTTYKTTPDQQRNDAFTKSISTILGFQAAIKRAGGCPEAFTAERLSGMSAIDLLAVFAANGIAINYGPQDVL